MKFRGFTKKQLLQMYRIMFLSRYLDEKQLILLKQGKGFFHIGAAGHEAVQIAAGLCLKPGSDYFYPYYRDQALCITLGMTAREILLSFLAKADDPNSGGRQMPMHYGHKKLRIVSQSSPTGTQYLQAVGTAFAIQRSKTGEVVYVSSGEGSTSQGDFHEALNWASRNKSPVIFLVENNHYAISVPVEDQTSGGAVFNITAGYENLSRFNINGCDIFESHLACKKAVDRARRGKGPSIIVSDVVRLLPHSSSDDQRKYRTDKDLASDKKRDPLVVFTHLCTESKVINHSDFEKIKSEVKLEVDKAAVWAENQASPNPNTVATFLYSDMANNRIDNEPPKNEGESIVLVDAINHAMAEELDYNDKLIIYGQDISDDKGGVFTATKGLSTKFGKERVFNAPLAESSIVGTAIGYALYGYKPVIEIQFGDYIWTSMMQIRNELATMRYRSNGDWSSPVVIRVPVGGYIHGALCHSQSIDGYFAHLPGINIAYPSNAADAKGLLKTACRMNDPVLYLEHKGLYRQGFASSPEPDKDYLLPFGKANVVQKGNALTIVTWGALVQKSIEAVKNTKVSADIIDIRTLNPLDMDTILDSIKKTNRVIVVHEDNITNGFGGEIVAQIVNAGFESLDAPVKRIASKDIPVAYASELEDEILVQSSWIETEINDLMEY